jgi:pimeloyl-ACP methyl ester carboxylesterase
MALKWPHRYEGAQLFVLEGSGHTPQIEEPEAFWEVALPFLAGKT